jgi:hypothetical protein
MTTPVSRSPGGGAGSSVPVPPGLSGQRDSSGLPGRLRQLGWASMPVWSLSMLAFAPFLRIALARRRARDWAVFAGYLAAVIVTMILMSVAGPGPDDAVSAVAGILAIVVAGAAAVHAFVAFRPGALAAGGSRAGELALAAARARMRRRQEARELADGNPALARELGIGRPDALHDYDDGGLVDVNHVPGDVLAACLGLTDAESASVITVREQLGRFSGPEELTAYTEVAPGRVDALRDLMLFG